MSFADMRKDYRQHVLLRSGWIDPLPLFADWFAEAKERCPEANACVLATVDGDNRPSARVVLCKGCDESGFRFLPILRVARPKIWRVIHRLPCVFIGTNLSVKCVSKVA